MEEKILAGLPWLSLGYSQTGTWMAGLAPVLGVYGLSALLLLGAGALLTLALSEFVRLCIVGRKPPESILSQRSATVEVTGVVIDTRQVKAGDMFVAIKGERVDGHDYLADAAARGAVAALVTRKIDSELPQVLVDDATLALGDLDSAVREQRDVRGPRRGRHLGAGDRFSSLVKGFVPELNLGLVLAAGLFLTWGLFLTRGLFLSCGLVFAHSV